MVIHSISSDAVSTTNSNTHPITNHQWWLIDIRPHSHFTLSISSDKPPLGLFPLFHWDHFETEIHSIVTLQKTPIQCQKKERNICFKIASCDVSFPRSSISSSRITSWSGGALYHILRLHSTHAQVHVSMWAINAETPARSKNAISAADDPLSNYTYILILRWKVIPFATRVELTTQGSPSDMQFTYNLNSHFVKRQGYVFTP